MNATRVKVCGLTRPADVAAAIDHGAWALGFVVWRGSPRAVSSADLRELVNTVPAGIKSVAVTVNPAIDEIRRLYDDSGMTAVQLHGGEDVEPFLSIGIEIIKAVSLESDADVDRATALPAEVTVLVDAHDPVRRGGTGARADWTRAALLATRRPVILAGGLRPENVASAIHQVKPWGIDVSSGLESEPGIKDHAKMDRFFEAVRYGGQDLEQQP